MCVFFILYEITPKKGTDMKEMKGKKENGKKEKRNFFLKKITKKRLSQMKE